MSDVVRRGSLRPGRGAEARPVDRCAARVQDTFLRWGVVVSSHIPRDVSPRQQSILARLETRLAELPLLPVVLLDLMRLDPDDAAYFTKVVTLIGRDPAYAARVLRAANSAYSAPVAKITALSPAISRIGVTTAVNLVVADAVVTVFAPRLEWERSLWTHTLGSAQLAKVLVPHFPGRGVDPEAAYLGGLLHDIGRFILYTEAPEELRVVEETAWESPEVLEAAETSICGYTHAELGYAAARKWRLPDELATIIRHHHTRNPGPPEVPTALVPMLRVIGVADALAVATGCRATLSDDELGGFVDAHVDFVAEGRRERVVRDLRAGLLEVAKLVEVLGITAEPGPTVRK